MIFTHKTYNSVLCSLCYSHEMKVSYVTMEYSPKMIIVVLLHLQARATERFGASVAVARVIWTSTQQKPISEFLVVVVVVVVIESSGRCVGAL